MKINEPDLKRLTVLVLIVCAPEGGVRKVLARDDKNVACWDVFKACCKHDDRLERDLTCYLRPGHILAAIKHIEENWS